MTSRTPRVSVCIPTFKGAATLGAAIESVLAQSFIDFELIVVDDGSPDETADVVAGFNDPRLRYLRNAKNLGPEGNWNRCLAEARGEYFKLLPHDDLLAPRCLERQVAALQAGQGRVAMAFCRRDVLGPNGRQLMQRGYPGAAEGVLSAPSVLRACVRRGTNLIGEPGAVLMPRELAERVGPFDGRYPYVIDLDYWFRLLEHGDAHYCDEALASFRVSGTQWSVVIGAGQSSDFRGFVRHYEQAGRLPTTWSDRLLGRVTPTLNTLARLLFYRVYLGRLN